MHIKQQLKDAVTDALEHGMSDSEILEVVKLSTAYKAYRACKGNETHASKMLGICRGSMRKRLKMLNIKRIKS